MKLVPMKEKKRSTPNSDKSRAGAQRPTSSQRSRNASVAFVPSVLMHHLHSGHEMHMEMHSTIDLADPMSREGSGTSWLPDSSPMYGKMFMFGEDMLMLHGAIFPRYTNVSTRRGDDRIDAPNWIMGMYSHPLGDTTQIGGRLDDEPRPPHRRRTRLSASVSNRRIVARPATARSPASARSSSTNFH